MKLREGFVLMAALAVAGCGVPTEDEPSAIESEQSTLWQSSTATLWPHSGLFGTGPSRIRVCFEFNSFSLTTIARIRNTVENNWERFANIDFFDWDVCPDPEPTSNVIRVKVSTFADPTILGQSNVGKVTSGFNLIEFASSNPPPHTIIHEFGHALGFIHENNDGTCQQRSGGGTSLEAEGDLNRSVLSSSGCNTFTQLSAWDILGVRRVYGTKAPGTIAGANGLALTINGASTALGTAILGQPSQQSASSRWTPVSNTNLRATISSTDRCLNVQGGVVSPTGPTPLISWSCDPSAANEQFKFTGVQWLAMGNKCIQADSATTGANLSIQTCGTSTLQKWDFFNNTTAIRLNGTNLCVQVPGGSNALGTLVNLTPCTGSSFQFFSKSSGRILWSDKCFNVFGGTTTPGNRIGLWDGCTASPPLSNSVFTISGQIHGLGGQCVAMSGGVVDNTQISVAPCQNNGAAVETWETYW